MHHEFKAVAIPIDPDLDILPGQPQGEEGGSVQE
jgi:hypothetical protein